MWGWWAFVAGEDMPHGQYAESVRLGELGELSADDLAALRERANEARLRIGTPRERLSNGVSVDARAVGLWEAVNR